MSKREHAIALRDLALTVVRARGSWQTVGNKLRLLTCRLDDVRIALQTPLQQEPSDIPPLAKYLAAHHGKPTPVYLPYVMDVWDGGKVLSVQSFMTTASLDLSISSDERRAVIVHLPSQQKRPPGPQSSAGLDISAAPATYPARSVTFCIGSSD